MSLVCDGETKPRRDGECRAASDVGSLILLFAKKVFRHPAHAGTNESERWKCSDFWHSAKPGDPVFAHLLPAFTSATDESVSERLALGSRIQLQQRNCFRFSRNSFHPFTDYDSQRTAAEASGGCRCGKRKILRPSVEENDQRLPGGFRLGAPAFLRKAGLRAALFLGWLALQREMKSFSSPGLV